MGRAAAPVFVRQPFHLPVRIRCFLRIHPHPAVWNGCRSPWRWSGYGRDLLQV